MIGSIIDNRYRVEVEIGCGGMANVYKAFDTKEKRPVALKVIKKEYCINPNYVRRFEHEANTVLTLRNKNIACAYDYGTHDGQSYIALEYIEGCTIKDSLREHGAVSPKVAVKIICSVLDALECAHNAGYIHRDVKPQNVLISTDKTVKLTDFGIAKDAESCTKTYDGKDVIGSVHYLSPEQAKGEIVGKESDLYSVGIMLYEMLVGEPPFDGDNPVQIALKHINENIIPPMDINAEIPPSLSDVVVKATSKEPEDRYNSAADMKQDLLKALAHPNKRFVNISDDIRRGSALNTGKEFKQKPQLWHVILPVSLVVSLVVGIFVFWYFYMFKDASNTAVSTVPGLLGETYDTAAVIAGNREFELTLVGTTASVEYPEGTICWQSPNAGSTLKKNSYIEVMISSGSDSITMIDLAGMTLEQASAMLQEIGMFIETVSYAESEAAPGTIIRQSIAVGDDAVRGDGIDVEISGTLGITQIQMPDLTGTADIFDALELIKLYGLTDYRITYVDDASMPDNINGVSDNSVISQNPSVGIPIVPTSTKVDIYVYHASESMAYADFSYNIVVDTDETPVLITMLTDLGEVVLYETVLDSGKQTIEFHAEHPDSGEYVCIIYMNNIETLRFDKTFSK